MVIKIFTSEGLGIEKNTIELHEWPRTKINERRALAEARGHGVCVWYLYLIIFIYFTSKYDIDVTDWFFLHQFPTAVVLATKFTAHGCTTACNKPL